MTYKPETEADYLAGLNEQQREAVLENSAPLLVLAGAGSGKTRVITTKIVHLITALGYRPESILAVTFTNKAAAEMKERAAAMMRGGGAERVMIKTFHSFGAWLLRRSSSRLQLAADFTIYDEEDSLSLLHRLYPSYRKNELKPYINAISRAKDYCLGPNDDLSPVSRSSRLPAMYAAYEKRLRSIGNVDFGDLISRSVELLNEHPDVRQQLRTRFRAILVDEYQDSNYAQFALRKQLFSPPESADGGSYLCVVGDDDQSIYRFRGAELKNILSFPDVFPAARVIKLEQNYRSTGTILKIAEAVVARNQGRHGKQLWTQSGEGKKAHLHICEDETAEARLCAEIVDRDGNYDGTAVLYRTNAQSRVFETVFMRMGIPYKIVGALRFYEREEVKDALALLALILNPADEIAFRRIINKPSRGIGEASLKHIIAAAEEAGGSCPEGVKRARTKLSSRARGGADEFIEWYTEACEHVLTSSLGEFARTMLENSGLLEHYRRQDESAMTQKVGNLEQLVNAAAAYPPGKRGIALFLESLELDPTRLGTKDPAEKPGITLITMHNTKGLEFDRVIITGLEEGLFPSRAASDDDDIEEERRIFYVSITRARKELHFTLCRRRSIWGRTAPCMPSQFVRELPEEYVEFSRQQVLERPVGTRSFTPERTSRYRELEASAGTEDTSRFAPGDRVYHDEYGPGYVISSTVERGREMVSVRFDTGQTAQFIPRYTSSLEKIAGD